MIKLEIKYIIMLTNKLMIIKHQVFFKIWPQFVNFIHSQVRNKVRHRVFDTPPDQIWNQITIRLKEQINDY